MLRAGWQGRAASFGQGSNRLPSRVGLSRKSNPTSVRSTLGKRPGSRLTGRDGTSCIDRRPLVVCPSSSSERSRPVLSRTTQQPQPPPPPPLPYPRALDCGRTSDQRHQDMSSGRKLAPEVNRSVFSWRVAATLDSLQHVSPYLHPSCHGLPRRHGTDTAPLCRMLVSLHVADAIDTPFPSPELGSRNAC